MKIVVLGSGNVATHIACALDKSCDVVQVYSPNISHARLLADKLQQAEAVDTLPGIKDDADLYVVSVKDDAIRDVALSTPHGGLWVHTSGSVSIDVFDGIKQNYGVFYPLQTFSKDVAVDIRQIPFFIEGNDVAAEISIRDIALSLSPQVFTAGSAQRQKLHIAAVFACNFANRLWAIADDILRDAGYEFDVLAPLLKATLSKAIDQTPLMGQTGPARRGDFGVIENHLSQLSGENAEIYRLISNSIYRQYNHEQD